MRRQELRQRGREKLQTLYLLDCWLAQRMKEAVSQSLALRV